jgi:hypothetical protein
LGVIAGHDPAIHLAKVMDARIKSAHDWWKQLARVLAALARRDHRVVAANQYFME